VLVSGGPACGAVGSGGHSLEEDSAFRAAALDCLDGLYGFAHSLARDRSVAEDLVQETYLRALGARRKAAGEHVRPWLFTILRNLWKNELRRRQKPEPLGELGGTLDSLAAAGAGPEEEMGRQETRERIRDALHALPEEFREVVVLRCVEGFSYRDMASILGCPAGTVMSRLARARGRLRKTLGMLAEVESR